MEKKYYVTQITRTKGSPTAIATFEYSDLNAAMGAYHSTMASVYATAGMEFFLVYVEDERGTRLALSNQVPEQETPVTNNVEEA